MDSATQAGESAVYAAQALADARDNAPEESEHYQMLDELYRRLKEIADDLAFAVEYNLPELDLGE